MQGNPARLCLDLGSAGRTIAGFTSVDIAPPADQIVDLAQPWPWADSSVDQIRAHDIIEHLPDKIQTMNEMWRVLKPGGEVEIQVPTTNGPGAWQDPQHVSFYNRQSFYYYTKGIPEYERFHVSYGIRACFDVVTEKTWYWGPSEILTIVLRAVK